ncbi:hypothetical protein LCGC14_3028980, partial [marine sediment metagenome]
MEDQRPPREIPWPFIRRTGAALLVGASIACGTLWVWPGFLLAKPWQRPGPPPQRLTLLLASQLHGHLEP